MNIENLIVDKPYSLREICELLGVELPRGKAQQLFLNNLTTELQKENKTIIKSGSGKGTKYTIEIESSNLCSPNLHRNDVIEFKKIDNSITLTECKNGEHKNDNEKRETTDPPKYYENKTDDQLFCTIFENKNKLKVYNYYTYKKLCEILEIPYIPKGGGKDRNLSFIEQQICLLKENNKYKVLRIYKTALPRVTANKNNAKIYGDMLLFALVKFITDDKNSWDFFKKNHYLYFSRSYLSEEMYLCNEDYNRFKSDRKTLSEQTNVPTDNINDFYYHTDRQMKSAIQKGLKNLSSRRIIKFNDSDSSIVIAFKNGYKRLATYEEIGLIIEAEMSVKKKLNITNLSFLIMNGTIGEFYKAVEIYIREQTKINQEYKTLTDLDYYYKAITIFGTIKTLSLGYLELMENIEDSLREANITFINENLNYYNNKKDLDKAIDTTIVPKGFGETVKIEQEKEYNELKMEYLQSIYLLFEKLIAKAQPTFGAYREINEYGDKIKK